MHAVGTTLDYAIIVGYMIFILLFGSFFGRFVKTTKDFFLAGQRFTWWLVSFSAVASLVGSYSFIKYSEAAYLYGLSSTQAYLNDFWWVPIWMFGWIPVIYYMRVTSIPEYMEIRHDAKTRMLASLFLLLYMLMYVGMNLYTMGVALNALLGWPILVAALVVAVIVAIYCYIGGQTSVIMTDLVQAVFLLIAGITIFFLGISKIGGFSKFWHALPYGHRFGLAYFNKPPEFNFVGVFWQDGIANTAAFWFMNQGIMLRFMSAKSVREARKAMWFTVLLMMPIAAVAVSGAGWVGKAFSAVGILPADASPKQIFVLVTNILVGPGLFGFIMAALVSALMSTVDTLVNAIAAVWTNDFWKRYIKPGRDDKHYLLVGRITSLIVAFIGLCLVPAFMKSKTIYVAHATFTAAITPPLVTVILLSALWRRFTPKAAFWTLLGGGIAILISFFVPDIIKPFAHGMAPGGHFIGAYKYMRALYGLVASFAIGIIVTFFTKPKSAEELIGLTWGTEKPAVETFKEKVKLP